MVLVGPSKGETVTIIGQELHETPGYKADDGIHELGCYGPVWKCDKNLTWEDHCDVHGPFTVRHPWALDDELMPIRGEPDQEHVDETKAVEA